MKAYIISVICACVVAFIVSTLAPDGEGGGLGKGVKLAIGLMLISVCLFPIIELVEEIQTIDIYSIVPSQVPEDYSEYFDKSYSSAEKENLIHGIEKMLCDKFEIDESDTDVSVILDDGGNELERIFIKLYGRAIWKDTGDIEAYFKKIFDCEVITAIGQ